MLTVAWQWRFSSSFLRSFIACRSLSLHSEHSITQTKIHANQSRPFWNFCMKIASFVPLMMMAHSTFPHFRFSLASSFNGAMGERDRDVHDFMFINEIVHFYSALTLRFSLALLLPLRCSVSRFSSFPNVFNVCWHHIGLALRHLFGSAQAGSLFRLFNRAYIHTDA